MTEQALDQLARRVLLDAARQEYGALIAERPEREFSPSFERKMKKLLQRAKHPTWHRIVRAVACLLLVALLTGCAVLAVSPEAREALVGWVREVYERQYLYRIHPEEDYNLSPEDMAFPEIVYRPTWVPTGYQAIYESIGNSHIAITYKNDFGDLAVLSQMQRGILQVTTGETDNYTQVFINGTAADLYLDPVEGESNVLIWEDGEWVFALSALFSGEEMMKMAESLEAQETPKVDQPAWLPDKYNRLSLKLTQDGTTQIKYTDGKGHSLELKSIPLSESTDLFAGQETSVQSVLVGDSPAELYLNQGEDGANELVWKDEEKGLLFWLHGPVTEEELIKIAESIGK